MELERVSLLYTGGCLVSDISSTSCGLCARCCVKLLSQAQLALCAIHYLYIPLGRCLEVPRLNSRNFNINTLNSCIVCSCGSLNLTVCHLSEVRRNEREALNDICVFLEDWIKHTWLQDIGESGFEVHVRATELYLTHLKSLYYQTLTRNDEND